jgi:hypothetical protein
LPKPEKTVVGNGPGYFRYEGKWYTRNKQGELIRYYPPDERVSAP